MPMPGGACNGLRHSLRKAVSAREGTYRHGLNAKKND